MVKTVEPLVVLVKKEQNLNNECRRMEHTSVERRRFMRRKDAESMACL